MAAHNSAPVLGRRVRRGVLATPTLESAVAQSPRASTAMLNGESKAHEALFADRKNITLKNRWVRLQVDGGTMMRLRKRGCCLFSG